MKNILKYNKIILVIYMIVAISFGTFFNCYVIAASNIVNVSGPASVEEGKTITFNITFSDNVKNIWLSDGDIIKKGFSGTVSVNKVSDRSYTVSISNVSNIGAGKYIVINSGVGYIDGKPTDSASSNLFEIIAKKEIPNDENNGSESNNGNTKPNPDENNKPIEKPNNGNNENVQKPNEEVNKPNDNINDTPNNNTNNGSDNGTSNKPDDNANNNIEKVPDNSTDIPNDNKPNNDINTKPNSNTNNNVNTKPNNNTNNNVNTKPNNNTNNNVNTKPNNNTNNNVNNNINNKPVVDNSNTNETTTNNNADNVQNNETVIEEIKIKREIPNTGKLI